MELRQAGCLRDLRHTAACQIVIVQSLQGLTPRRVGRNA